MFRGREEVRGCAAAVRRAVRVCGHVVNAAVRGVRAVAAVALLGERHDRLLFDDRRARALARLRAARLGRALECLVDSAHYESPLLSQLRKARSSSSWSGAVASGAPPPSNS